MTTFHLIHVVVGAVLAAVNFWGLMDETSRAFFNSIVGLVVLAYNAYYLFIRQKSMTGQIGFMTHSFSLPSFCYVLSVLNTFKVHLAAGGTPFPASSCRSPGRLFPVPCPRWYSACRPKNGPRMENQTPSRSAVSALNGTPCSCRVTPNGTTHTQDLSDQRIC